MSEALALHGVAKRFGQVRALVDASLLVPRGSIVALLGENGAGKTTLMRVAFGMVRPDAGEIRIEGRAVRPASPAEALRMGLGMVHQHFALVPALTATENVALGGRGWFSPRDTSAALRAVAGRAGLHIEPAARVESMSAGAQQRLEVLKALARGVRCLILDEPTAVLTPQESAELLRFLREFAAGGGAVVLITHKLREALGVADQVTVIRAGRTVLTLFRSEASERVIADAMLGESAPLRARQELLGLRETHAVAADAPVVASVENVVALGARGVPALRGGSLALRAGEIVGVTGVEGSGVHELVRVLAGRLEPVTGRVALPPGIGFVPEDRLRDALVPEWSVVENLALKGAGSATGVMPWTRLERQAGELLARYDVRGGGARTPVASLSGGNQQKLVLGRELEGEPALLVIEQPTRGLDIAAAAAIHERLLDARDRGAAILLASADLDELLMLADRVVVVFDGQLREVVRDAQAVGRAMIGLHGAEPASPTPLS